MSNRISRRDFIQTGTVVAGLTAASSRNAFGRALVIGREAHPHMAIVENGIVLPVGLLDLIQ